MKGKYLTCIENAVKRKLPAFLLCLAIVFAMMHLVEKVVQEVYAEGIAVAKIGETEYTSLKAAVEAAGTGPTEIELVRDTVEEIKIPKGADITIDLKGNKIASRAVDNSTNAHTIENFGTLTLLSSVGEGTIDCVIHAKACVMNQPGGKVTMSGKLSLSRSNLPLPKEQERGSWYNICNRGTMIIGKDVKVINNDNRHTAVTTGFLEYKEFLEGNYPEAKLIVNGGYFMGKLNAFKVDTAGILEINDGEIENPDGVAIISWNELKINGGTIKAKTPLNLNKYNSGGDSADPVERGITVINGGNINCTGADGQWMFTNNRNSIGGARLTINGGTFNGSFGVLKLMGTNSSGEHLITCYVNGGKYNSDISEYVTVPEDKCAREGNDGYFVFEDHSWDDGAVTSAPTTASAGVKTFKCKKCEATRTEAIPQLTPEITPMPTDPSQNDTEEEAKKKAEEDPKNIPAEVTATTPANTAAVVKLITTVNNDNDLKGSSYAPLKFQSKKVKNKSISLQWTKVKGANQYTIYGNECGAGKKYKKLVTVYGKTNKYTITQIVNKKLQKGKAYKFLIIAEKEDKTIAISKTIHVRTKGHKKYDNSTKVTVKKGTKSVNKVNVGKGKKMTIKAIASLPKGKALDKAHQKMRYETSNKAVATINSKGKIKGVKKGTCYIYAYSQNGVAKKIKVLVK